MTLYELVDNVKLQGNIRISMWDFMGETEKVIATWENSVNELFVGDIEDEWADLIVDYIFCPGDGWLHIEVKEEE